MLTYNIIRILIKNNLSKFHIDENFANLIIHKIKQILANQYDLFNSKKQGVQFEKNTHEIKELNINESLKELVQKLNELSQEKIVAKKKKNKIIKKLEIK